MNTTAKIMVFTYSPSGCNTATTDNIEDVFEHLKLSAGEAECQRDEETTEVRIHWMTRSQFDALPEFEGF